MARGKTSRSAGKSSRKQGRASNVPDNTSADKDKDDPRPMEERLHSIEHNWSSFSPLAKRFLLQSPNELTLQKLVDFFSQPDEIAYALMSVSVGTAHMLAYEYFNISAYENAKALTLCGAFFQQVQCPATPIEKIMGMSVGDENVDELPFYHLGESAVKDQISISCYLKRVLPLKYQKMMGFASHSSNAPGMQYVNLISNDWNGGTSSSNHAKHQKEKGNTAEITIVLSNKDDDAEYQKNIKMGMTLKSLFNDYAYECGVSLRALRFSYNGSTLFLSSVGHKTPEDMGMKHMDMITVTNTKASNRKQDEKKPVPQPKAQLKRKTSNAGKGKQEKKQSAAQKPISLPDNGRESDKFVHSKLLTKVFEEMQPKLKIIRQQLNDLTLVRQNSKTKNSSAHKKTLREKPIGVPNPSLIGTAGKAGRVSFVVNVGRVENLYKTSKRRGRRSGGAKKPSMAIIDLHGCTKTDALARLGTSLKEWLNTAMVGSYPWVIPATIVCGAGNQILSEVVEQWIKETKNVANAPKGSIASY